MVNWFHQLSNIAFLLFIWRTFHLSLSSITDNNVVTFDQQCERPRFSKANDIAGFDIYYINLDDSTDRRLSMEQSLAYYGLDNKLHRVPAFTTSEIIVPEAIRQQTECLRITPDEQQRLLLELNSSRASISERRVLVTALCGRPKNTHRELTVTLSHLLALRMASHGQSRFALILEDDLQLFLEANWQNLLATAPHDWAMLQLVTSNDYAVMNLWKVYMRHKQLLWVRRKDHDDYWCAGAYLLRTSVVRPLIDQLLQPVPDMPGMFTASIVAGYSEPCYPKHCCHKLNITAASASIAANKGRNNVNGNNKMILSLPCIKAIRGFQSDTFVFSLFPQRTHMLTVPFISNSLEGNRSTVHQRHVDWHQAAFRRGRKLLYLMLSHRVPMPPFLNPDCRIAWGSANGFTNRSQSNSVSVSRSVSSVNNKRGEEEQGIFYRWMRNSSHHMIDA